MLFSTLEYSRGHIRRQNSPSSQAFFNVSLTACRLNLMGPRSLAGHGYLFLWWSCVDLAQSKKNTEQKITWLIKLWRPRRMPCWGRTDWKRLRSVNSLCNYPRTCLSSQETLIVRETRELYFSARALRDMIRCFFNFRLNVANHVT